MILVLYRTVFLRGAPFIRLYLWRRRMRGREGPVRFPERLNTAGAAKSMVVTEAGILDAVVVALGPFVEHSLHKDHSHAGP